VEERHRGEGEKYNIHHPVQAHNLQDCTVIGSHIRFCSLSIDCFTLTNKFRFIMTDRTPYWDCWSSGRQWAIKVSRLGARLQENRNKMDKFVQYCKIC
jgi:hypothetical protein